MHRIIRILFLFCLAALTPVLVNGQIDAESPSGRISKEPLPKSIQETMAKKRIEEEKKEYEDLLTSGETAVALSKELHKSFAKNNKLTSQDKHKLKTLEKLLKQIRKDLGGSGSDEDEDDTEEKPKSTAKAMNALLANTQDLFEEIKKTTRHSISAAAIGTSNVVLGIVKFLRFGR